MPNKINFYGGDQIWFSKIFKFPDKNLNIGIINWWWVDPLDTLEDIENFIDSQDICFFLSEEIVYRFSHININDLLSLLNRKNVFNIFTSEEYDLDVQPIVENSYYFPWFFKTFVSNSPEFKVDLDYTTKKYDFNLLLGSDKGYRTVLFKLLKENKSIYSSYLGHPKFKIESDVFLDDDEIQSILTNQDVDVKKLNTMLPITRNDREVVISHCVPENIYANTHFDIVSETFVKNNHHFTTEKTAKPLSTGRFFCWYASPNLKDYLTKYGFSLETYYGNYDNILDDMNRMVALVDDIEEISNNEKLIKHIYETSKDERIHNQMMYRDQTTNFLSSLEEWIVGKIDNA